MAVYRASGSFGFRGVLARLARAEAFSAAGRRDDAFAALTEVGDRIRSQAAAIDDPEARRIFLDRVPENARAFTLEHTLKSERALGA
jgi:hypothetical protein